MAWGLDLGYECEDVRKVLRMIIRHAYLLNLESLLEWVVLSWGFNLSEGIPENNVLLWARHSRIPFLHSREEVKAQFRDVTRRGWEGLVVYVQII